MSKTKERPIRNKKRNSKKKEEVQEEIRWPKIEYLQTKEEFDIAVGKHFIDFVNRTTKKGDKCIVGLSHGISPSGAYQYILDNYDKIKKPALLRYTFVNTILKRQDYHKNITDAHTFLKKLQEDGPLEKNQILGSSITEDSLEQYGKTFNRKLKLYLKENNKEGLDYVFTSSAVDGSVAGIRRKSDIFDSNELAALVKDGTGEALTITPKFLMKTRQIAFLATKSRKRLSLAWLFFKGGESDDCPSFLRYMDEVDKRLTVFVDDNALTWPQIVVERKTKYGISEIKIDLAKSFNPDRKTKIPVIVLIHGFLGLNSFDNLLTSVPTNKYITAAMHYGSIPYDLPPEEYSEHVVRNIDAVIKYFGELGHPVYLFDHSMGNIYFLMIDRLFNKLPGAKKYLKGRIGGNPFFGEEAKHALLGFMDTVIIPSISGVKNPLAKSLFYTMRTIIPLDGRRAVRKRSIRLSKTLIKKDTAFRDKIWNSVKERILYLMNQLDSLPQLNRIPIAKALNRLPAKVFVIQTYSAMLESLHHDKVSGLKHMKKNNIPVLILKSKRDAVAKYVDRIYDDEHCEIMDITNYQQNDLFAEHLYHMIFPIKTTAIIDEFISKTEINS